MKKPLFKHLKLGQWLQTKAPKVLDLVDDIFPPVKILTALLENAQLTAEDRKELSQLLQEYEAEIFRHETADRASARNREIEIRKAGGTDWLFYLTGITGLAAFMAVILSIIMLDIPAENEALFTHLVGMIEGVAITIFAYYFGSSKGSQDKTVFR